MVTRTKVAPPNSVVLVSDVAGGEIPKSMQDSAIAATSSCVAVGCLSEDDGETEFTLGALSDLNREDKPAYEGLLRTPNHKVTVCSVLGEQLLEVPVSQDLTRLKIWINDESEPDNVVIGVG